MLDAHVVKRRRPFTVDVHIHARPGEKLALFGASGAGKSTVLSCLAGIDTPDDGQISFGDLRLFPPSLPLYRRPLAYLTQASWLFPHLTVGQNVCYGLHKNDGDSAKKWIEELKERLDLSALWNESASRISGGQARRVALARMLARRPPLVLLDEPFTALDRPAMNELIAAILDWHAVLGFTLIAVDHRAEVLEKLCPSAMVVERGRVVQEGSWSALAATPATPLLAQLLDRK